MKIIATCQLQDLMESHFTHTKHSHQDRATSTQEWYTVDDDTKRVNITEVPNQEFINLNRPSTSKFSGRIVPKFLIKLCSCHQTREHFRIIIIL